MALLMLPCHLSPNSAIIGEAVEVLMLPCCFSPNSALIG